MGYKLSDNFYKCADQFGSIAGRVNESSKKRKEHCDNILALINKSFHIGEELNRSLNLVADLNNIQNSQDFKVFGICKALNENLSKQNKLLETLELFQKLDEKVINSLTEKNNDLCQSVEAAILYLDEILNRNNKIILLDKQISIWKKNQQKSISTLKNLAAISLTNAERAIKGSSSNLKRGIELVEKLKGVDLLIDDGNINEIVNLKDDIIEGREIAEDVNQSSTAQHKFAEMVMKFTHQLHENSVSIKEMVTAKHGIFENNLQTITVLTVILSLQFKKYLDIHEIIEGISVDDEIRLIYNNLKSLIEIACVEVEEVTSLNFDMTDKSHHQNKSEVEAVKLIEKELEYFNSIKRGVEEMTEVTEYPIEGSARNIRNGRLMETHLVELLNNIQLN